MNPAEIRKLFDKFDAQLDNDDVWEVQKAVVIKHKALERLAAAARISFEKPQVLRAERDEAVILVHGSMCAADNKNGGETRHEWSVGEARVVRMVDSGKKNNWGKPVYEPGPDEMGNYQITPKQAAYPYAMAEKRAKDRVILKLAGLHGLYSEDEADEFKEQPQSAPVSGRTVPVSSGIKPAHNEAGTTLTVTERLIEALDGFESAADVFAWWSHKKVQEAYNGLSDAAKVSVDAAKRRRLEIIESPFQEAAE